MYAIQHKPSGKFLPKMKYVKGGTHTELDDPRPPRLFTTHAAATNCLRHWLSGIEGGAYEMPHGPDWANDGGYIKTLTPQPHRKAEDMEIIEVFLVTSKPTRPQLRALITSRGYDPDANEKTLDNLGNLDIMTMGTFVEAYKVMVEAAG